MQWTDNFRSAFVSNFRNELTGEQLSCLELIDQNFEQMGKDKFSPEQVRNSVEWQGIRELASDALKAFAWPLDDPPRRDHEFVPGRPSKRSP